MLDSSPTCLGSRPFDSATAPAWCGRSVDAYHLSFGHPDWVALQTRQAGLEGTGEVRLRDLVKESLRMRPSRIMGQHKQWRITDWSSARAG